MRVVCTAGHVDHGKSSLVRALTGMEPDRLDEERRRGLTIELGFAWTDVNRHRVAFVDLPGHERFVPTMLAGAGPVGCAVLVVAADEGWMPQSTEHLAILDLLGITDGVVALTKADLVDAETAEIAAELVREQLAGSTLADAPMVAVSARTGNGLDQLRRVLAGLLDRAPEALDRHRPRLWIDRVFTITGAGTVVTGTLGGGAVAQGDELTVLGAGRPSRGRVRGLQALEEPRRRVAPGSRVAVNLAGLDRRAAARGDALVRAGQWLSSVALDAHVRVLAGCRVERRGAWHVHVGSAERAARIRPTLAGPVTDRGTVRIELSEPLPLQAGDRVVLREAGRDATVGGGTVLDPAPPPRPRGPRAREQRERELVARATALADDDRGALLECHVGERGLAGTPAALAAVGLAETELAAALRRPELVGLGDPPTVLTTLAALQGFAAAVREALARHHREHPLDRSAPRDVATRALAGLPALPGAAGIVVDALVAHGAVAAEGPGLRLPGHRVDLQPDQERAAQRLVALLTEDGFEPRPLPAAAEEAGVSTALVRELLAGGRLVRLAGELAVPPTTLQAAEVALRQGLDGPFTASRARELLATTRKYALPLLEELDRRGRTRRRGDERELVDE